MIKRLVMLMGAASLLQGCVAAYAGGALATIAVVAAIADLPSPSPAPANSGTFESAGGSPALIVPSGWQSYEDYGFRFYYPGDWKANDTPIQSLGTYSSALTQFEKATGKATFLGNQTGQEGMVLLQIYTMPSTNPSPVPSGYFYPCKIASETAQCSNVIEYPNGKPLYSRLLAVQHEGIKYAIVFLTYGLDDASSAAFQQSILNTWLWKTGGPSPVSPSP